MLFIEPDGPECVRPGTDQNGCLRKLPRVRQQPPANPEPLTGSEHVGVADERYVFDAFKAHNANKRATLLVAPEHDTSIDLVLEFVPGHIRLCPAVSGDHSFVGARAVVNGRVNLVKFALLARTNHRFFPGARHEAILPWLRIASEAAPAS